MVSSLKTHFFLGLLLFSIINQSAFAKYDLNLMVEVERPIHLSNFHKLGKEVVDAIELYDRARDVLTSHFKQVKRFSPLESANFIVMLRLTHGNAYSNKSSNGEYCLDVRYEASGQIIRCDEDVDSLIEGALDEFVDQEDIFLDRVETQRREIDWLTFIDSQQVIVNGAFVSYEAKHWENNEIQSRHTWIQDKGFLDRVRGAVSNYFTEINGHEIPFYNSSDLISIAMQSSTGALKNKDLISKLLNKLNSKNRMLPFYLKQAVKVNAPKEIFKTFKEKRKSFDAYKDAEGNTPLFNAAANGHSDLVYYLVDEGSDVNYVNKAGLTPLHLACLSASVKQSFATIDYLLSQGLDINHASSEGVSCLPSALAYNALNDFPMKGNDLVDELVRRGVNINLSAQVSDKAFSPLLSAIYYKDLAAANRLIELGANPNQKPLERESALHLAVRMENISLAQTLIDSGSNLNSLDGERNTALFYAFPNYKEEMTSQHMEMVKLLVSSGANQSLKNKHGLTAKESYVNARANYLEEQRQIAYNKRMQELRKERMEEIAEARRERNRQRRAAEKRNGFQWGNFLNELSKGAARGDWNSWAQGNAQPLQNTIRRSVSAGFDENYDFENYRNSDYEDSLPYMETVEWARQKGEEHKREIERLNQQYGQILSSSNISLGYDDGSAERARIAKLEAEQERRAEAQRLKNEERARIARTKHRQYLEEAEQTRKRQEEMLPDCMKPASGSNPNPEGGSRVVCM